LQGAVDTGATTPANTAIATNITFTTALPAAIVTIDGRVCAAAIGACGHRQTQQKNRKKTGNGTHVYILAKLGSGWLIQDALCQLSQLTCVFSQKCHLALPSVVFRGTNAFARYKKLIESAVSRP
jgi:hypothetical protein